MESNKKPTVAIFDLDGTITKRDTYVAYLLGFLLANPHRVLRGLHLPFAVLLYALKFRDNSWLKVTFLRGLLGNMPRTAIDRWTSRFVDRVCRNGCRAGALKCLREHKKKGHRVILATASLDVYVIPIARSLGFDDVICTEIEWDSKQRITGRLKRGNCHGLNKLNCVRASGYLSGRYHTVAYSDHHSDLPLLLGVDTGIAVHPTRKLQKAADYENLEIAYWDR